jgi:hypothetical protein
MYLDCISDLPVLGVRTPKQWTMGKERKWHSTEMAIEEEEGGGEIIFGQSNILGLSRNLSRLMFIQCNNTASLMEPFLHHLLGT